MVGVCLAGMLSSLANITCPIRFLRVIPAGTGTASRCVRRDNPPPGAAGAGVGLSQASRMPLFLLVAAESELVYS